MEKVILLVEDNADDEALTLRALRKNDIRNRVVVARDGQEALDYLLGEADAMADDVYPNVMLLDLKLPKVSGLEVLRRIREHPRGRYLPVIVLTSSMEDQDILSSYDLGANSYIRKPVNFDQFLEAVRQMGRYWLGLNVTPSSI